MLDKWPEVIPTVTTDEPETAAQFENRVAKLAIDLFWRDTHAQTEERSIKETMGLPPKYTGSFSEQCKFHLGSMGNKGKTIGIGRLKTKTGDLVGIKFN